MTIIEIIYIINIIIIIVHIIISPIILDTIPQQP